MLWINVRNFFYKIYRSPRKIKWAYQRLTRGYSDKDMWNADVYIARVIAGSLTWFVENGHGVAFSYIDPSDYDDLDGAIILRDEDYLKYAALFAEYGSNGVAMNKKWKKQLGGISEKEYRQMMKWLGQHLQELWD